MGFGELLGWLRGEDSGRMASSESMETLCSSLVPYPKHLVYLAVPELCLHIINQSSSK